MVIWSFLLISTCVIASRRTRPSSYDSAPTADSSFGSNDQSSVYDFYDMTLITDDRENLELLENIEQLKTENENLRQNLETCQSNLLNSAMSKSSQYDRIPIFFWYEL